MVTLSGTLGHSNPPQTTLNSTFCVVFYFFEVGESIGTTNLVCMLIIASPGSSVDWKSDNISETVLLTQLILVYDLSNTPAIVMTLSDLEGHTPIASLFKCDIFALVFLFLDLFLLLHVGLICACANK